jgi:signal transduction histidine kinase
MVKSKYFQVFLLIGLLPVLILTGVYVWTVLNPTQTSAPPVVTTAPAVSLSSVQSDIGSLASSLYGDIKKTHDDSANLVQRHTDADLSTFVQSHPSVSGIIVASFDGKTVRSVPVTPFLTNPAYGSSDEFKSIVDHLKSQPGSTYQFYTRQLTNPSFVFALNLSPTALGEVVFNLGTLFKGLNLHGGQAYILEAKSGQYLYHTNPAALSQIFNSSQNPNLTKVQTDIEAQQAGTIQTGTSTLVYAPLFGSFGLVEEIPQAVLNPPVQPAARESTNPLELLQTPVSLAAVVVLAWIFLMFYAGLSLILGPLKKAKSAILAAAQNGKPISSETLKQFGRDEVGQMVQAASDLLEKLEKEKAELERDKEEAIRQARALIENKNKEAQQIQQQADAVKKNLNDITQQLNDKLKELDALKAMSEGLRNQTEQSKADNAKLKTQISGLETSQADFQKKLTDTESKLKESEAKLLQAVSTASPIQVSQVRAAAIKTMAEELKTTLGIIKGYVSSALGASQGGINEKQQEFLGMVINRSARLEKFINDLVDIYQVEIEQADAKTEEINLASEIEGLAFNFQAQAEVKNIKIKVDAKPNVPKIPIVRRRFNQLWNILYLQIIKDAPRGSSISITIEPLGLFDDFYDPKHPASAQLAGTGLKFALIKTILAAHGGGAVAEPAETGTKLILTFPSKKTAPVAATAVAPASTPAVNPTKPAFTIPGLTPKPAGTAATAPMGPKLTIPGTPATKTPPPTGVLDSLISGNTFPPPSPGGTPPPKPATGPVIPPAAKPPLPSAPTGVATPKIGIPGLPSPGASNPLTPSAPPKSPVTASAIDSLLSGNVPPAGMPKPAISPAPGIPPAGTPRPPAPAVTPVPGVPPMSAPKPPVPGVPPSSSAPPLGAPRPPISPAPGIPAPGTPRPPAPAVTPIPGVPPVSAPKPPVLGVPPSSSAPPLGAPRPPISPAPGIPAPGAPRPPAPPVPPSSSAPSLGAPKPPMTPIPGIPVSGAPRPSASSVPPIPGTLTSNALKPPTTPPPGVPKPPVVVPTSMKPTTPPEGILDLDNLDSFKMDDGTKPTPKPSPPPPTLGEKPIVKDLNKEGEGEIIE